MNIDEKATNRTVAVFYRTARAGASPDDPDEMRRILRERPGQQ